MVLKILKYFLPFAIINLVILGVCLFMSKFSDRPSVLDIKDSDILLVGSSHSGVFNKCGFQEDYFNKTNRSLEIISTNGGSLEVLSVYIKSLEENSVRHKNVVFLLDPFMFTTTKFDGGLSFFNNERLSLQNAITIYQLTGSLVLTKNYILSKVNILKPSVSCNKYNSVVNPVFNENYDIRIQELYGRNSNSMNILKLKLKTFNEIDERLRSISDNVIYCFPPTLFKDQGIYNQSIDAKLNVKVHEFSGFSHNEFFDFDHLNTRGKYIFMEKLNTYLR